MLELSPRLLCLADLIPPGVRLVDVGTDHAYLPVYLLRSGRISHAIASDLREGPLLRGKAVAKHWDIRDDQISFRCCDGLRGVSADEVDHIVIAGMGGETIVQCLDGVSWSGDSHLCYLLQPMTSAVELRFWLSEHSFLISEEFLVKEGEKLYVILKVSPAVMQPLTLGECWLGRQFQGMHAPLRTEYINDVIARRERALSGMRQARNRSVERELRLLEETLEALYRMREEWITWQR